MKNSISIILIVMISSLSVYAQSNKEEIDYFQSIFGMEKKALIADFILLESPKKETFWTLYDKYEVERKQNGKKRIALLSNYAENYEKLLEEKVDELVDESIKIKSNSDKLIIKYYKQMKKTLGAKAAAQFYQIENYLESAIRLEIFESIPLIDKVAGQ